MALKDIEDPIIRRVYTNNNISRTLIISIPNEYAEKHGIKIGINLLVLDTREGIVYKPLVIK